MLVSLIFIDSLLIGHELNSPQSSTEFHREICSKEIKLCETQYYSVMNLFEVESQYDHPGLYFIQRFGKLHQ